MNTINLSHASAVLLAGIGAATRDGGFTYESPSDVAELTHYGFVEQNVTVVDGEGKQATRATDAGMAYLTAHSTATGAAPAADTSAPAPVSGVGVSPNAGMSFAVASFDPAGIVKATRAPSERKSIYPFDDVPAPTDEVKYPGFFVPASEKMPEPWKSLQSGVSAQNRKHGTVVGTETRNGKERNVYEYSKQFAVAKYENNGTLGAMVYRVK